MRGRSKLLSRVAMVGLLLGLVSGCARGCTTRRPPIHLVPDMDDQPKLEAQEASEFFYDGKAMQVPPEGTVARGAILEDPSFETGRLPDGSFVAASPLPADPSVLERGRERYDIYCAPCHDPRGTGRGILYERGNVPTRNLHEARIRTAPDGQLFDTITNGVGLMPGYRWPIPPRDRWAIVAYVRKLEQEASATPAAEGAEGGAR